MGPSLLSLQPPANHYEVGHSDVSWTVHLTSSCLV